MKIKSEWECGRRVPAWRPVLLLFNIHHYGESISTAFVESTVNEVISRRMKKKQQMRWTKEGAHLLLQVRIKTLNNDLHRIFERWYPKLKLAS